MHEHRIGSILGCCPQCDRLSLGSQTRRYNFRRWWKMAAVVVWRRRHRRNLRRNRVFQDRKNPLDMYMYDDVVFAVTISLYNRRWTVRRLRVPRHTPRLLAGYSASYSGIVDVCDRLFPQLGGWDHRHQPVNRIIHLVTNALVARMHDWVQLPTQ